MRRTWLKFVHLCSCSAQLLISDQVSLVASISFVFIWILSARFFVSGDHIELCDTEKVAWPVFHFTKYESFNPRVCWISSLLYPSEGRYSDGHANPIILFFFYTPHISLIVFWSHTNVRQSVYLQHTNTHRAEPLWSGSHEGRMTQQPFSSFWLCRPFLTQRRWRCCALFFLNIMIARGV